MYLLLTTDYSIHKLGHHAKTSLSHTPLLVYMKTGKYFNVLCRQLPEALQGVLPSEAPPHPDNGKYSIQKTW